jgi:drug/metabolite transporter (DMT)-like permease
MNKWAWIAYALSASVVWGFDYVLAERFLKANVSPLALMGLQSIVMAIVLVPLAFWHDGVAQIRHALSLPGGWWQLPLVLVGFTLGNFLIAYAIRGKNATLASLLEISYPLPIILFSLLLLKTTHLNMATIIGGFLIAVGVVVVSVFG